jgi:hypothetical protein
MPQIGEILSRLSSWLCWPRLVSKHPILTGLPRLRPVQVDCLTPFSGVPIHFARYANRSARQTLTIRSRAGAGLELIHHQRKYGWSVSGCTRKGYLFDARLALGWET